MKLHGRNDDIKLLRSKLRELAKAKDVEEDDEEDAAKYHVGEMILVSGTSGTGKSTRVDAFSHLVNWKINYTAHCQHSPMP